MGGLDLHPPNLAWSGLIWGIAKDAPTGSRVIVHTPAMLELTRARLQEYGRTDMVVELAVPGVSRDDRAA